MAAAACKTCWAGRSTAGAGTACACSAGKAVNGGPWHGRRRAANDERALGLTVPLFAAVSSFYSHGGSANAPRLVLPDKAFAGIDDAARTHCMALVREFDLDFVMTSEREWACCAELPGASICQLQRHEGIDAVYVSRWSWDGRVPPRSGWRAAPSGAAGR